MTPLMRLKEDKVMRYCVLCDGLEGYENVKKENHKEETLVKVKEELKPLTMESTTVVNNAIQQEQQQAASVPMKTRTSTDPKTANNNIMSILDSKLEWFAAELESSRDVERCRQLMLAMRECMQTREMLQGSL
jgi:hypothetical protein